MPRPGGPQLRLFVSHSHYDRDIVEPLVELFRLALGLTSGQIFATSVPGSTLETGTDVDDRISKAVKEAAILIAVITPASLQSSYSQFEWGARWAQKGAPMLALLCGTVSVSQLPIQIRRLKYATLDHDLSVLLGDIARLINVPLGSDAIEANRSRMARVQNAAARLYPDRPIPLSFEGSVDDPAHLSEGVVKASAARLHELIYDGGEGFRPDLLVALNQGGMIASAMMQRWLSVPVGVAFTELGKPRKIVSWAVPQLKRVRRALIVDSKVKSGVSAVNVAQRLLRELSCDVRLAALIAYGPWSSERWEFDGVRWPVVLRRGQLPTYVAYHTPMEGTRDLIHESWRDDIILPQ